ncbi:MAG TPA: single-stranded DNA-binding protein [Bacteroidetes bacterium]|nr:single-stranded DNA-binding protein [Bacteroidota bacterium]
MARGLNKVLLIGNLGKDPEMKYTSGGTAVANFSIAVSESWKDNEGNKQERTEWVNIVAWRKVAEICSQYLKKGSRIYVEGKLQCRSYEDKNGVKRYVTEVVMDQLLMLDSAESHTPPSQPEPDAPSPGGKVDDLPFVWLLPFILPLMGLANEAVHSL